MANNNELADSCFVYIIGTGSQQPKTISFHSESYIRRLLERNEIPGEALLLYYRYFDNEFDALAHKLMLQTLCDTSLNCVISRKNPGWEDLRENLKEELMMQSYCEE